MKYADPVLDRIRANTRLSTSVVPGVVGPCWLWVGRSGRAKGGRYGYVTVTVNGITQVAHRWVYEQLVEPLDRQLTLDHLCRRTNCVNPAHQDPCTQRENNMRSAGLTSRNLAKTHCPQGHPYDEENTYHMPNGGRDCRQCILRRSRERNERRRAARHFFAPRQVWR